MLLLLSTILSSVRQFADQILLMMRPFSQKIAYQALLFTVILPFRKCSNKTHRLSSDFYNNCFLQRSLKGDVSHAPRKASDTGLFRQVFYTREWVFSGRGQRLTSQYTLYCWGIINTASKYWCTIESRVFTFIQGLFITCSTVNLFWGSVLKSPRIKSFAEDENSKSCIVHVYLGKI